MAGARTRLTCGHSRNLPTVEGAVRKAALCTTCKMIVPVAAGMCRCSHAAAGHRQIPGVRGLACDFPGCGCEQWRPGLAAVPTVPDTAYYRNPDVRTALVSQDVEGSLFTIGSDFDHVKIIFGDRELTLSPDQIADEVFPAIALALFTAGESSRTMED